MEILNNNELLKVNGGSILCRAIAVVVTVFSLFKLIRRR